MLSPQPGGFEHFEQILIHRTCREQIIINLFRTPTNLYYITLITLCYYSVYLVFLRQPKPQLRDQVLIKASWNITYAQSYPQPDRGWRCRPELTLTAGITALIAIAANNISSVTREGLQYAVLGLSGNNKPMRPHT
jgi:hypothetical protein